MRRPILLVSLICIAALGSAVPSHGKNLTSTNLVVRHGGVISVLSASQSTNWFGYNQGSEEKGTITQPYLFHGITASWSVPSVSQKTKGQDEFSSTWAGIGGGCVNASCSVIDNTLIQAGTEQDVSAKGTKSYYAWYELIPAPSINISASTMTVAANDRMSLTIVETVPGSEVWTITLTNLSRNQTFSITVPYTSTYGSAEWIEETPLIIGTNAGFGALPNLTKTVFDSGTTNGVSANLVVAEQVQLINGTTGKVYGAPSPPDSDSDGFADCAWASSCSAAAS